MSQGDLEYQDVIYREIANLHHRDQIPWGLLSNYAGYKGENSIKNIVQQGSHKLEFSRGLRLLFNLSDKHNNKRLHKHCINTRNEMIVDRPKIELATGHLEEASFEAMQAITKATSSVKNKDTEGMQESYQKIIKYMARLRAEIEVCESVLAKVNEGA